MEELILLGETVRESKKILQNKLEQLLKTSEKKVSEWKSLLNKEEFEKSLRITFILTMAISRGSNYFTWNKNNEIAIDYTQWRKKFIKSNKKFLYSTQSGFINLGRVYKSPFERSSRVTNVLELNEDNEIEYVYDATTYNGFDSELCTYHQKFRMDITNHHIVEYSSSDDRYDLHWWLGDLNRELKKI
jgi:hypothetical protein